MAGTLLAYDDAFPRARVATGPIRNTPSADELRANSYPEPFRMLPLRAERFALHRVAQVFSIRVASA